MDSSSSEARTPQRGRGSMRSRAVRAALLLNLLAVSTAAQTHGPYFFVPTQRVGHGPGSIATGDFNGDGREDIVTDDGSYGPDTLSVLLGAGDGTFAQATSWSAGPGPGAVVVGDFNGDGKQDMASGDRDAGCVSILLGAGDGSFPVTASQAAGVSPTMLVVGDFDADGHEDLGTVDDTASNVVILLGHGDGTFNIGGASVLGTLPHSPILADLDLDGIQDIAIANPLADSVSILRGHGDGTFAPAITLGGYAYPYALAVGDVDVDGVPDVATANRVSASVTIRLGLGDVSFVDAGTPSVQTQPTAVAFGDFDADDRLDLVSGGASLDWDANRICVLAGCGDGTFLAGTLVPVGWTPASVAIADFNADGKDDVATANFSSDTVSVLVGTADGMLETAPSIATGAFPRDVVVADLDGDGGSDVVVLNSGWATVSILTGQDDGQFVLTGTVPVPGVYTAVTADFDGDGRSDLATANGLAGTVSVFLSQGGGAFSSAATYTPTSGPISVTSADFDGDGTLDLATANPGTDSVSLFFGQGSATFVVGGGPAVQSPYWLATADFDVDGRFDLAAASVNTSQVTVLVAQGGGVLSPSAAYAVGLNPGAIASGDINADGLPDLATADASGTASILIGQGAGLFANGQSLEAGLYPSDVACADVDADGRIDLAVTGSNVLEVHRGQGDATFTDGGWYGAGATPIGLATGDFNADGRTDVVTANYGSNDVTVCLNRGVPVRGPALGSVHGRVVLGSSQAHSSELLPMRGVQVVVSNGTSTYHAHTTSSGEFYLSDVTPGTYGVSGLLAFVEPATGVPILIRNYPDWNPESAVEVSAGSATTVADIIVPWPVVLQAGLYSSTSAWSDARAYLESDSAGTASASLDKADWHLPAFPSFPMPSYGPVSDGNPAGYDNRGLSVDDHARNADALQAWIASKVMPILAQWVAPPDLSKVRINLVAHSMGGLIARVYEHDGKKPAVARGVYLDAVHGGSVVAAATGLAGLWEVALNGEMPGPWTGAPGETPSTYDYWSLPWNTAYRVPSGETVRMLYSVVEDPLMFDTVAPDASAWGIGRAMCSSPLHYGLGGSFGGWAPTGWQEDWIAGIDVQVLHTNHTGVHDVPAILHQTAAFFAYGTQAPPIVSATASDGEMPVSAPSSAPGTSLVSGTLTADAGMSAQVVLQVDGAGTVLGHALLVGQNSHFELASAGSALPLQDVQESPLSAAALVQSFSLGSLPSGPLALTLTAAPAGDARLDYSFELPGARSLVLLAIDSSLAPGAPAQLIAAVTEGGASLLVPTAPSTVVATVRGPVDMLVSVPLLDDGLHGDFVAGDGVFGGSFAGTTLAGRYMVDGQAALSVGGVTVQRSASATFSVMPAGAALAGAPVVSTPDLDFDGLLDSLDFAQPVAISGSGSFTLSATLRDGAGAPVAWPSRTFKALGGSPTAMTLSVQGPDIVRHAVDGPWRLTDITLFALDAGALPAATLADQPTPPYAAAAFEPPAPPNIQALLPHSGPLAGGNEAVVMGTGLADVLAVQVGGIAVPFVAQDDASLRITMPPATGLLFSGKPLATVGTKAARGGWAPSVEIVVQTAWGSDTEAEAYQYVP